jgi:C-terminal processing protease CtpA/Prc
MAPERAIGRSDIDLAPVRDSWAVGVGLRKGTAMNAIWKAPVAVAVFVPALVGAAAAYTAPTVGKAVFDRTVEIVNEEFYRPSELDAFNKTVGTILIDANDLAEADGTTVDAAIDAALSSLNTSHTARFTPDEVAYFELLDVFRFNYRRELRRLFPRDGEITYAGVGMVTQLIDGKVFVSDVYDGGTASRANIKVGDEILAADGEAFAETGSFAGKAGKDVVLTLRRKENGPALDIKVRVERLEPSEALLDAISESARIIDRDGRRIGYIRIWAYTHHEVGDVLNRVLGGGRLADVDGLVLDLRSRWGGAPADAAELFLGGTPEMEMIDRDGDVRYVNTRWRKPVVGIIDEGTRSGMDIFANAFKQNGIPLVGTETAGDVVAGRGFLLPDDSLLVLAVADVLVEGKRLEGHPVQPDIEVPFDIRYADGVDPQFDAALDMLMTRLTEG